MYSICLLRSNNSIDEFVKAMPADSYFVVLRPEYVCVPRFVEYAFIQAFKTFETGRQTANTISLEWLAKLALTKNVSKALFVTKPEKGLWCVACINLEKKALEKFGKFKRPGKEFCEKAGKKLVTLYNIPKKALEVYSLEDLLIEKAAVENI
ncbi:hypothetical protein HY571_02405 [Candidatus Micrarchaeota archaeon]|nr:hypothetical protein [Candidatus Micrarchaeota archaeon]